MPNGGTKGGVDYASRGLAVIVESLLSGLFRIHNSWEEAALEQPTNDWQTITIQLQIPSCHMRSSKQMHGYTPTAAKTALKVSSGGKTEHMCVSFKARRSYQSRDTLVISGEMCGEVLQMCIFMKMMRSRNCLAVKSKEILRGEQNPPSSYTSVLYTKVQIAVLSLTNPYRFKDSYL